MTQLIRWRPASMLEREFYRRVMRQRHPRCDDRRCLAWLIVSASIGAVLDRCGCRFGSLRFSGTFMGNVNGYCKFCVVLLFGDIEAKLRLLGEEVCKANDKRSIV